jgi:hypothetical protein
MESLIGGVGSTVQFLCEFSAAKPDHSIVDAGVPVQQFDERATRVHTEAMIGLRAFDVAIELYELPAAAFESTLTFHAAHRPS